MPKNDPVATQKFVQGTVKKTERVLQGRIDDVEKKLGTKIDSVERKLGDRIEDAEEKLRGEMKKNHNEVMEKLDSIAGFMKKTDEEQVALAYRVSEHSDQLENHEERLKTLEKPTS